MVDFIDFLQYGFDKTNAIYGQIYQIHYRKSKTSTAKCTIHQEAGRYQKEYIGNKHWWVW
jgi:hypothetical protein